jgi:hypothetical protein
MRLSFLSVCFLSILLGCQPKPSGPPETVITGQVLLDGKVLTMGQVVLENSDSTQSGLGEITSDGKFRIPSAPLGNVRAAVRTSAYARFASAQKKDGKAITMVEREGTYIAVPKHYEDPTTSKLTYTITKETTELKIELTSK